MKPKLKILFVIGILDVNGATKSLMSLLRALSSEEYDLSLFLYTHDGYDLNEIPKHVKLLPEDPRYAALCDPGWLAAWKALKIFRIDVLVFRLLCVLRRHRLIRFSTLSWLSEIKGDWDVLCAYADGLGPICLNRIQAKKKLLWIHCDYVAERQGNAVLESFRKADGAVAVSETAKEKFLEVMGGSFEKPLSVVHNLIDADNCRTLARKNDVSFSLDAAKRRVVSVGRLDLETKGFDLIPQIAQMLKAQGKSFEWLIVGGGGSSAVETLKMLVVRHGVEDCVKIVGEVFNPYPLIDSADIIVQLSRHESWGMTVSEALILGKPVVVSDIPSFCEQVKDGENGLVVPIDAAKFALAISRLMEDEALCHRLGEKAKDYPFTAEKVREEFRRALESCC